MKSMNLKSGERMFAGGRYMAGGCSAAKPPWSEVMKFLGDFIWQGTCSLWESVWYYN